MRIYEYMKLNLHSSNEMTEGQIGISDRRTAGASIAKLLSFSVMCVISALSSMLKVMRMDPAMVFSR